MAIALTDGMAAAEGGGSYDLKAGKSAHSGTVAAGKGLAADSASAPGDDVSEFCSRLQMAMQDGNASTTADPVEDRADEGSPILPESQTSEHETSLPAQFPQAQRTGIADAKLMLAHLHQAKLNADDSAQLKPTGTPVGERERAASAALNGKMDREPGTPTLPKRKHQVDATVAALADPSAMVASSVAEIAPPKTSQDETGTRSDLVSGEILKSPGPGGVTQFAALDMAAPEAKAERNPGFTTEQSRSTCLNAETATSPTPEGEKSVPAARMNFGTAGEVSQADMTLKVQPDRLPDSSAKASEVPDLHRNQMPVGNAPTDSRDLPANFASGTSLAERSSEKLASTVPQHTRPSLPRDAAPRAPRSISGLNLAGSDSAAALRIDSPASGNANLLAAHGSKPAVAPDPFSAIDMGGDLNNATWFHAGPKHAEAGFADPELGWVAVRADLRAGGLHASIGAASAYSASALSGELAGLSAHLADRQIAVHSLSVATGSSDGGNLASASQQGRREGEDGEAGQSRTPEKEFLSRASPPAISEALLSPLPVYIRSAETGMHISIKV